MRKFTSILLATIIFVFSLHLTVSAHICKHMGVNYHIGFVVAKPCSCKGNSCCTEVVKVLKLKSNFLKEDISKVEKVFSSLFVLDYKVLNSFSNYSSNKLPYEFHSSPLKTCSLVILNRSILL